MLYHRLAVALFAAVTLANPVPEGTDACSTVKCKSGTKCEVVDGKAQCTPTGGEQCGAVTCGDGEYCCNDSCSICSPIGDMCTMQICQPEGPQCGPNKCHKGFECCNESCGICVKEGEGACTQQVCERDEPEPEPTPLPVQCGSNTCDAGEVCCNESCGICVKEGEGACTQQVCERDEPEPEPIPEPVQCGPNTCDAGEVCCNESCGICTPPDGACTEQFCFPENEEGGDDEDEGYEEGEKCGPTVCSEGLQCCNSSCGYCTAPGEGCTKEFCNLEDGEKA